MCHKTPWNKIRKATSPTDSVLSTTWQSNRNTMFLNGKVIARKEAVANLANIIRTGHRISRWVCRQRHSWQRCEKSIFSQHFLAFSHILINSHLVVEKGTLHRISLAPCCWEQNLDCVRKMVMIEKIYTPRVKHPRTYVTVYRFLVLYFALLKNFPVCCSRAEKVFIGVSVFPLVFLCFRNE